MKISKANEIKLIFVLALSLVVLISLITFDPNDVKILTSNPNIAKSNVVGFIGVQIAWWLFFFAGLGAYAIPIFIALWGIMSLLEEKPKKIYLRIFGTFFSILAISSIFSILGSQDTIYRFNRGGIIGLAFSDFLLKYLGGAGTLIVITVLFLLSFLITTDFLLFPFVGWILGSFKSVSKKIKSLPSEAFTTKVRKKPALQKEPQKAAFEAKPSGVSAKTVPAGKDVFTKPKEVMAKSEKEKLEKSKAPKKPIVYDKPYEFPGLDLLSSPPPIEEREIKEDSETNSSILEEVLGDFGIEVKVVEVNKGPVITRYEMQPASGVKIHKITSLSDNIALAMKAVSIRIVAPIPGKGTVGVEVPNQKSTLVYLKELLESKEYKGESSKLKLALGKDISGTPIVGDLDEMPHLLIAGATGSGKTVCVNSIITSLLYNASPEELKFLMVDPKRVELAAFNNLPHLLAPVVTEPKKVSHALNWSVNEMERRYELFAGLGVRNIAAYNKKIKTDNLAVLPYIVLIIDELADLMLVSQQEVESMITRLAQLSRAVGIHMIIATQRPSVDVITGVIKANFPSRISFKVASKVDSRTVIDINGADKLLGRGDMLFVEPGNPKPIRAQGSLVSDEEINKLTAFIKAQRQPEFEEEITKVEEKQQFKKFERDEIYEEAVKLVLQTKQASVSMLQRRLGVGYTRAARLIDMMEDEGIIGPYQGSKPREILVDSVDSEK